MKTQLMKYQELQKLVETATAGMKLKLTFIPYAPPDDPEYPLSIVLVLWGMVDGKIITIDEHTNRVLSAVHETNKWGSDNNRRVNDRTIVVEFLPNFDKEWFLDRLNRYLQNAELCLS